VVESLANFLEHRDSNNLRVLSFQFTTTARITREAARRGRAAEAGLHAWQRLRELPADAPEGDQLAEEIRALLLGDRRPRSVDEERWHILSAFLESASVEDLRAFVVSVDFVTNATQSADIRVAIERDLVGRGFCTDLDSATRVYDRLFVRTFERLSSVGLKRLTTEELQIEVRAGLDGAQLPQVSGALRLLAQRLETLEADVAALQYDARAGLSGAAELLPIGDTVTFQSTASYFGNRLQVDTAVNHARALLGRDAEMSECQVAIDGFLASERLGVVLVTAQGGMGKSRFLLAVAREWEANGSVRWVRDGQPVAFQALGELPQGPLLIVCDDAQRQGGLTQLLALAKERRDATIVCLGMRPYGRASYEAAVHATHLETEQLHELRAPRYVRLSCYCFFEPSLVRSSRTLPTDCCHSGEIHSSSLCLLLGCYGLDDSIPNFLRGIRSSAVSCSRDIERRRLVPSPQRSIPHLLSTRSKSSPRFSRFVALQVRLTIASPVICALLRVSCVARYLPCLTPESSRRTEAS
jgi:hypothetical protein